VRGSKGARKGVKKCGGRGREVEGGRRGGGSQDPPPLSSSLARAAKPLRVAYLFEFHTNIIQKFAGPLVEKDQLPLRSCWRAARRGHRLAACARMRSGAAAAALHLATAVDLMERERCGTVRRWVGRRRVDGQRNKRKE
jgi:hypothetical protein